MTDQPALFPDCKTCENHRGPHEVNGVVMIGCTLSMSCTWPVAWDIPCESYKPEQVKK
jgi:hypothetical protein